MTSPEVVIGDPAPGKRLVAIARRKEHAMKSRTLIWLIAIAISGLLGSSASLVAQDQAKHDSRELHHYVVTTLGTLGGGFSSGNGLDSRGSVAGTSNLPGDATEHAFIWQKGVMTDLGTFGGPNSDSSEGPGINDSDEVVGFMTIVQVAPEASVDEPLQAAKGLTRIGVAKVIDPSPHHLIHLLNKLCGRNRCPPLGEVFDPSSDIALCALAGKDVDVPLAAFGRAALHELKPDEVESIDQLRDPSLFAIDRQSHP
jgi:probable HAF family extracellular repeat protein